MSLDAIWREYVGASIMPDGSKDFLRKPEGVGSAPHLILIFSILLLAFGLAVLLGLRNRKKDTKTKCRVLLICAIIIDGLELFKIINYCCYFHPMRWIQDLPLYLCSIQFITIPLAALSKGRLKEASLDFVLLFGLLGGVFGTVGATQNYKAYPVISMHNITSAITHSGAAFASVYIAISGLSSMKKENIRIILGILFAFCFVALVINECPYILNQDGKPLNANYMFLKSHDGTPYKIIYDLVWQSQLLYSFSVVMLFVAYIYVVHLVRDMYLRIRHKSKVQTSGNSMSA